MNSIQPYLDRNSAIPIQTHCTLPNSVITLETPPGITAYRRQYPVPVAYQSILREQVQKWLNDGVIELAAPNTEWNSPILFVKKKDAQGNYTNDVRPCIDPRHVNRLLVKVDRFPLPLINEMFAKMGNAKWFTTLDLKQAFHSLSC
ncbi:unnamed protein product [Auanema sp. JU1783]|nr:unnamed protein product [Auanema sp. JU1783]